MYAIIETGGKQFKIEEGSTIKVEKLEKEVGETIEMDKVLMIVEGEHVKGGADIGGAKVIAEVIEQARDRKIIIQKFKRKKGYRKKMGHRQPYTKLLIKEIKLEKKE
jgi:large subunit ribosomal protein L21